MVDYADTYYHNWTYGESTGACAIKTIRNTEYCCREPFGLDKKFLEDQKKGVKYYTYLNKRSIRNNIKKITPYKFILWDKGRRIIYRKVVRNNNE
jgi:hypothetical protein